MKDMDYILVMNRGKLVEAGTQEQLMAQEGLFSELVKVQRGERTLHEVL